MHLKIKPKKEGPRSTRSNKSFTGLMDNEELADSKGTEDTDFEPDQHITFTAIPYGTNNYGSIGKPLLCYFEWNQQHYIKLKASYKAILEQFLPNKINFETNLSPVEVQSIIPKDVPSIPFFIQRERLKKIVTPMTLSPFECCDVQTTYGRKDITFYAGSSVWAMDWCPYVIDKVVSQQYLAIATHSDLHFFSSTYKEDGIIQLWSCGGLELKSHNDAVRNLMSFLSKLLKLF